jgi:Family of unknown function (DUF6502)
MTDEIKRTLHAAVLRLLRPLVRLLLHHSVPYETFADLARWVYVDVAEKEFKLDGKKQTTSRISVITGLNRKEVARLQDMPLGDDPNTVSSMNRAGKVVTAWLHEYPRANAPKHAVPLPLEGEHSFATLVKRYSGDMPTRAVLDELLRVGVVRKLESGDVELLSSGDVVPGMENRKALLSLFGEDTTDFISTYSHNIFAPDENKFFQQKTYTDNIPVELLGSIKLLSRQRGQAIMDQFREEFSKVDRDVTPEVTGTGRARALFGVYYYEEILEPGDMPAAPDKASKRK